VMNVMNVLNTTVGNNVRVAVGESQAGVLGHLLRSYLKISYTILLLHCISQFGHTRYRSIYQEIQ
jgi:hypothetical protein